MADATGRGPDQDGVDREGEVESVTRATDKGPLGWAVFALCFAIAVFHIWANVFGTLSTLWLTGIHFAGFALLCALRHPMLRVKGRGAARAVFALDLALGLIAAGAVLVLIASETAIYDRGVRLSTQDWILAFVAIAAAVEFTRRTTGWIIPILIVTALTYVSWWGGLIEGPFRFSGLTLETIVFRSIFSDEGMFGTIGRISATFVFMFILFGAFLVRSGAGEFIIDLARCVAGRFVGGPGFVAVISSGLTGTISGSAVANTVSTGVITIPLMKRSGFPPRFAAGVEAASSTGGQLMPPIMGAGAFVMATYTGIPYLDIVAVSFLPALLYFLSVGFFVRIEAKRQGLTRRDEDAPSLWSVLKRGPAFLLPIAILIGLLIQGFTPTYAAGWAILSVIVASWATPNRMGPKAIVEAMALGARNMITTAILLIAVGLIVNVIAMTGAGNTFSLMISDWAGGNLLIALTLIALASLVLGMGLPVTAAYIVLGTLSAPALHVLIQNAHLVDAMVAGTVQEAARMTLMLADPELPARLAQPMGREEAAALVQTLDQSLLNLVYGQTLAPETITLALLSAHMIIFWLSQDSNVTPPVCLTAFAAAAIAKSKPMATGVVSWKVAKGLYLMPVLFAYTPFLGGPIEEVLWIFGFALFGLYALGAAIQGHMEAPLNWPMRAASAAAGVMLVWPEAKLVDVAGLVLFAGVFALNLRQARRGEGAGAAA